MNTTYSRSVVLKYCAADSHKVAGPFQCSQQLKQRHIKSYSPATSWFIVVELNVIHTLWF